MSSSDSDDWWAAKDTDTDTDSGGQGQEDSAALADAAADLRYAAEVMRDAATPPAPEPESNWDFTWLTEMRKRSDNGWAFVTALFSFGPAWLLFLVTQRFEFWTATGITLIAFVFIGGWHLRVERKTTRLLTWSLPVGLAYYAPVAIVFGLAKGLVGG